MSEEKNSVEAAMKAAMKDAEFPDLKAILCHFTRLRGGPEGIAKMLNKAYKASEAGSMMQNMILQMVLQGAKAISAKESTRDTSLISDEDLEREAQKLMAKATK